MLPAITPLHHLYIDHEVNKVSCLLYTRREISLSIAYPKRTERKNKNREQLIEAANRLFATKGIRHTTLEDVATKAGVHVQTLYKHFRNKDELATVAARSGVDHCRERFENAPENQTAFQSWRQFIHDSVSDLLSLGFSEHKKQQLKSASSMMNDNYLLIVYSGYEDLLTEYLARDFQMDPKVDRLPRLVACMLWSGNEAIVKRCAGLDTGEDVLDDAEAVVTESLRAVDDIEKVFASYIK